MKSKFKKKRAPQDESIYKVKYVFNENSNIDVNEIFKKSFLTEIQKHI